MTTEIRRYVRSLGLDAYVVGGAVRDELLRIYQKAGPLTPEDVRRATDLITGAGGFERARRHALGYIERARRDLEVLPPSRSRDALLTVAEHVVERRK